MNGIFLLDKPQGITSNRALQIVKHLFGAKKAGHTGSLDPLATGLLPICFGKATKCANQFLHANKSYAVTLLLGVKTTTGDAEGEILETKEVPLLTTEDIEKVCDAFRGNITQIPPMFSALKKNGVPLYEYARKGITIERPPRPVTIESLIIEKYHSPALSLVVKCSKGTYIRTLAEDIGEKIGCGAHVTHLRRLSVGPFQESQMMTLDALKEKLALPYFEKESLIITP